MNTSPTDQQLNSVKQVTAGLGARMTNCQIAHKMEVIRDLDLISRDNVAD